MGLVNTKVNYTTQMVVSRIRNYTREQIVETNLQLSVLPYHTGSGGSVVVEVN